MEMPMARIETIDAGFYRIPLPVILSDSTHGEIKAFELLTLRVRDSDGAEGVGYTYTVGHNGGAIADILRREMPDLIKGREADDTEAIWQHVWWGLHYGGRGGPVVLALSALDIALWDLKARRGRLPLWRLLGGFDRRVPCYAGGIDLDLSVEALLKQTDDNLSNGFRAIKMKVGRPDLASDVARVRAMRKHLGDSRLRRRFGRRPSYGVGCLRMRAIVVALTRLCCPIQPFLHRGLAKRFVFLQINNGLIADIGHIGVLAGERQNTVAGQHFAAHCKIS